MLPSSPQAAPLLGGESSSSHSNSSAKEARSFCTPLRLRIALVVYLLAAVLSWIYVVPVFLQSMGPRADGSPPPAPLVDTFPGAPWRTSQTVSSTLLLSDKRMRVESHTVRSESGALMDNWIWMDVVDHINVVPYVLSPVPTDPQLALRWNKWREGHFVVFRQRKYGLRDESLAVAGGQVEMQRNEAPLEAAKRELAEEMFLTAPPSEDAAIGTGAGTAGDEQQEDSNWVDLGSYRVNVNRGHGTVSCFLLADARPLAGTSSSELSAEFKVDELERQQLVRLSVPEMQRAVRAHGADAGATAGAGPGAFAEIKWQATAAMALDEILRRAEEEDRRLAESSGSSTLLLRGGGSSTSHDDTTTPPSATDERRGRTKPRQQQPQQTSAPAIPDAADELLQQPQPPQAQAPARSQPPLRQRRTAPPPHRLSTRPEPLGSPPPTSPSPSSHSSASADDKHQQDPPIRGRTSRSAPRHTPDSLPPELEAAVKLDQAQPHA